MLCCCGLPLLYVAAMMVLPPVLAYRRRAVGRGRITAVAVGLPFAVWLVGLAAGLVLKSLGPGVAGTVFWFSRFCTCPPPRRSSSGR